MEEQYDREADWISEMSAKNEAYAVEAAEALWSALAKLDDGDNKINAEIRVAITGLSYLVGSLTSLKAHFPSISPDTTATTITPKIKPETPLAKAGKWLIGK